MGREYPDYRLNLERLNELYPDKEMLCTSDVAKVFGYSRIESVRKMVPFRKIGNKFLISKAGLARIMSGG